jgi:hypothetical protein
VRERTPVVPVYSSRGVDRLRACKSSPQHGSGPMEEAFAVKSAAGCTRVWDLANLKG